MPTITTTLESPVHRSFRVAQVAGMFGETIQNETKRFRSFQCEVPGLDEDWRVGLIAGPSGSGKSTIARAAYGEAVYTPREWPKHGAILDGFGDISTKQIVRTLTAVGLSSPPAWVRPYHTLSTGERFRCDLARALLTPLTSDPRPRTSGLVVFDEFTSSLDRNVARVCSAAVSKHIRRETLPVRFVAVTCHDDVAEWLEPDWILDMGTPDGDHSGRLSRRRLRRPPIELSIHRAGRDTWPRFAPHHYLSGDLHGSARCFVGTVGQWDSDTIGPNKIAETADCRSRTSVTCFPDPTVLQSQCPTVHPIAFAATLPLVGRKNHRRFHRLVVLPDYQGIGIGSAFLEAVAELNREEGLRINIATSHPAIIAHCRASPCWRTVQISRYGRLPRRIAGRTLTHSLGRATVSFEFVGRPSSADPAQEVDQTRSLPSLGAGSFVPDEADCFSSAPEMHKPKKHADGSDNPTISLMRNRGPPAKRIINEQPIHAPSVARSHRSKRFLAPFANSVPGPSPKNNAAMIARTSGTCTTSATSTLTTVIISKSCSRLNRMAAHQGVSLRCISRRREAVITPVPISSADRPVIQSTSTTINDAAL